MDGMGKAALKRLKKVILNDKSLPSGLLSVLRSDLNMVLSSYFDFEMEGLKIDIDLDSSGRYYLAIETPIERVKNVKIL